MIICLGTTPALQRTMVFPHLRIDAVNRAAEVREYASGKPVNVARVLHALGRRHVVTGFLGGDSGRLARADLDGAGVAHDFVPVAARTRMCLTAIDRAAGTATELIEEPTAVEPADYDALLSKLGDLLGRATVLVMSGSLPPAAPVDFYARCVRLATAARVATVLDAKGEPLRLALGERPTVVKPNRAELQETTGTGTATDVHLREAVGRLLAAGPAWALVTLGPDGAVLSNGAQFWRLAVPAVKAVSPIGSGDSVAAGLAAGIADGVPMPDACALGLACGVANALTPLAGHVRLDDVERLRSEISATAMD